MLRTIGRMIIVASSIALAILLIIECMFLGSYFMKNPLDITSLIVNVVCIILMGFSSFFGLYTVIKNNSGKLLTLYGLAVFIFGIFNMLLYIILQPGKDIWLIFTIMDMIGGLIYFIGAFMARERIK